MITTNSQIKKTALGRFGIWFLLLFLMSAVFLIYGSARYRQNIQELAQLKRQQEEVNSRLANASTLEKIGRHITLPAGQTATVVTIDDAAGLKKLQPLYANIKDGDQLVTFKDMQLVYDPIADVLLYVRMFANPVSIASGQIEPANLPQTQTGPITLDIRNGAGVSGLAGKIAGELGKESIYKVEKVGNGVRNDYPSTIIVNLKGRDVSSLENRFKVMAVDVLPQKEASSEADVILILGRDSR